MVTLSSCLMWQIISFILTSNDAGKWACDRLTEDVDFGKKSSFQMKLILILVSSFWSSKIVAFGVQKTACIHWKADAPETSHCLVWILVQRPFFFENEQGVTVNGDSYGAMLNEFLLTKVEEEDIGNIWLQQDVATCHTSKLHSMFCALFLRIGLSAGELMSFSHLGAAICYRWTIICGLLSKISATSTSQRQLTL